MIVQFTDFGLHGPYTGQMKAVLHQLAPEIPVVDLFADAPIANAKASAYLLSAYATWFPSGTVFLWVVDPGVGGTRPAVKVVTAAGPARPAWASSSKPQTSTRATRIEHKVQGKR